ncbi:LysR family transcriptional regulator [Lysobacter humi (ex Lee et al. 2017)]
MDIADLQAFVRVAAGASLVETAAALHVTPSAVSKALRRLEDRLGQALFERGGTRLALADAGLRLLPHAVAILDQADAARRATARTRADPDARIAGPALLMEAWAVEAVDAFRTVSRHGHLEMLDRYEDEAVTMVASGRADLGLVTRTAVSSHGAGVRVRPVGRFRYVVGHVASTADARPGARSQTERDRACLTVSPLCGRERIASRPDVAAGNARRAALRIDDFHVLLRLVRAGRVEAIVPDFVARASGLSSGETSDDEEELLVIWRESAPQWVSDFVAAWSSEVQGTRAAT